jgi:hypothetical protein
VALAAFLTVVRSRARGRLAGLGLAAWISPAAGATLLAWVTVAAAGRLAGAVGVLEALDVARPVATAFVGLAALALASTLPLAPGGAGVASVGMALALERSGVAPASAVAAAVTFHAVETLVSVVFGSSGWLALRSAGARTDTACPATRPDNVAKPALMRRSGALRLVARAISRAPDASPFLSTKNLAVRRS